MYFTQHVKIPRKAPVESKIFIAVHWCEIWEMSNTHFAFLSIVMDYMTLLYNSFWWATSEIERKSIEIYYDPRVAYFYQNVAIVGQFYEKKRLKYFVYVNRIDGKYNEKLRHVDHFFGMQSIKILLFFWDFRFVIEIKME